MANIQLIKQMLKGIGDESFNCSVYSSDGAKCGDGWNGDEILCLSSKEILYLLKQRVNNEKLFKGISVKEVDVDKRIEEMAFAAAWPNSGPYATVNEVIPDELSKYETRLEELDENDPASVNVIREALQEISDGDYTFRFTIKDSEGFYYFDEDAAKEITLTKAEALGLLYGKYPLDKVFEGLCSVTYDENDINNWASEIGFASDYDYFCYGGESDSLENYLNAWEYIISNILSGGISKEELASWLEYFSESDNYEMEISEWYDEREEDNF